jgi:hypothetical protein
MNLINATRMVAGYSMGLEPSGRELLVIAIKGTFSFPLPGEDPERFSLHNEQVPLVMADTFTGNPGFSAPVYDVDFAPYKPRCDILLLGKAYAPQGKSTTRFEAGLRIGSWSKTLAVVGPRHWVCKQASVSASAPTPFTEQDISYDIAFGGTDLQHEDQSKHDAFMPNPVGLGFHKNLEPKLVHDKPLPRTEQINSAVSNPTERYVPMAFGPVGRGWTTRSKHAGTYDDTWLEKHFPFLPPDFDPQYYQAAPPDQQVALGTFDQSPTPVALLNLTPEGITHFTIPNLVAPVTVFPKHGDQEEYCATLDTVVIEPEHKRYTLTWRMARPLKKNMFEITEVLVGKKGREWWQERDVASFPIPVVTDFVELSRG